MFDEIKSEILDFARQNGVDIGFAGLNALPTEMRLGFVGAVSVVFPLSHGVLREMRDAPTITYFAHYRAVNREIDRMTLHIGRILESFGYDAMPVPASQSDPAKEKGTAGIFPHKTAAVLSRLGWVGKNALFIHETYGSAVRLGTVLTDCPFPAQTPMASACGDCRICVHACPAQAIEGKLWTPGCPRNTLIDVYACSRHMKEAYQQIGRGVVCGLCMVQCPWFDQKKTINSMDFSAHASLEGDTEGSGKEKLERSCE